MVERHILNDAEDNGTQADADRRDYRTTKGASVSMKNYSRLLANAYEDAVRKYWLSANKGEDVLAEYHRLVKLKPSDSRRLVHILNSGHDPDECTCETCLEFYRL